MRPAYIQPKKGIKSSYTMYKILGPFYPVWKLLFRKYVSNTTEVGQAMINAVSYSPDKQTLENKDLLELANK